jgi:hypothetical protein
MSAEDGRMPSKIKDAITPLAAWYRINKPEVKRITVAQDDYDRLVAATAATLNRNGFRSVGGVITWGEFELVRK